MFFYGPLPQLIHRHAWSSLLTAPFSGLTLEQFGGTASDLIQRGQWWRLVTGTFVHVTVLHITLNMWCLWNLGLFGEPLLGKRGLVAVYLLTGTTGMMFSYAWSVLTGQEVLVVGASGAVFGIAGILIVLLSNRRLAVPWQDLRSLRRQVIFFAVANLVLGMAPQVLGMASPSHLRMFHVDLGMLPRIDNTAHLGGFLSGLVLGLPLFSADDHGAGKLPGAAASYVRVCDAAAVPVRVCAVGVCAGQAVSSAKEKGQPCLAGAFGITELAESMS